MKQRRGSVAYRISKPQVFDNHLPSTTSLARPSSTIKEESPRTNQVSPLIAYTNGVSSANPQKTYDDMPINGYSNGTPDNMVRNQSKNSLLSNEKSSSACTIQ